ncbi:AAA family ATPase [Hellea sp.]|nr:AAA family ATPase [Hellea sp.]
MKQTPKQMMSPTPGAPVPVVAAPMRAPMPMSPQIPMPSPQPMPPQHLAPQPMVPQAMSPQQIPAQQMVPQAVPPQAVPPQGMPVMQPGQQMPPMPQTVQTMAAPIDDPIEDMSREGGDKALPQISIHAFCDRQETAGVINESSRDWRMKRTNMKIYMGGLSAAIEFYHKENTPSLILVESGMRGPELFSQLEELASVCDAGTKVVIVGAANDIRLYRQLMDKGVSDYIVPPFHPIRLIRSLGELYSDPDKPFIGRVAAFFGAKGGVGSSTIAHNIAWSLAERIQQETALVDLDCSWGTTGLDFAYDASQGLEEALAEPERLDETLLDRIMIRHTPKLSILPTAGSLNQKAIMTPEAYEAVVNGVRSISPLTILDMPHYWCDWTTNVLINSDDVVITATPDLANLRNTKNLVDFLRSQRPNDAEPILILNKTGMTKTSEISVKDFASAVGLDPALVLGFEPEIYFEASNDGKMLTEIKAAAQAVSGIEYIARRLKTGSFDSASSPAAKKGSSLMGKLSKSKGDGSARKESKSLFSFKKKG